jgi:tRNA-splicing ligase RtcB
MNVINEPGQRFPIKAWTDGVELEESAREQLLNIARMPFIFKHVAVMPDVHWGMGATVGSVIATKGAVIPAAVGVDLGCGMIAQRTSLTASDLPDDLASLRAAIEAATPHGRTDHGGANDRGSWGQPPKDYVVAFEALAAMPGSSDRRSAQALRQLGTLGTGNHFIEVCLDESQAVWVMLHSGSRGIGNTLATEFITRAKETAARYFYEEMLPDPDLAFLPEGTPDFNEYVAAVQWAQAYAMLNRQLMMNATLDALRRVIAVPFHIDDVAVNCHHNYLAREKHFETNNVIVTRKGAVSAREGQLGIIPGSMGTRSYIVRGKGNPESFMSCSHGAGRRMSRADAKRRFTVEDHVAATAGVECKKDASVLDETPMAYKDVDAVIAAEADLIDIVHTLKAVLCVKG